MPSFSWMFLMILGVVLLMSRPDDVDKTHKAERFLACYNDAPFSDGRQWRARACDSFNKLTIPSVAIEMTDYLGSRPRFQDEVLLS